MLKIINKLLTSYKNTNVAVKASLWFAICSVIQRGISIITMPIFTRIMPTGEYGQYSIFQTWYNIFIILVTLNIHSEIFNKGLIDHYDEKNEYTFNQAKLLLILSIAFLLLYLIGGFFLQELIGLSYGLVALMVAEIFGNSIISLWSAQKRFEYNYVQIVLITLVTSILNPVVGIIAVLYSENKADARIVSNALIPFAVGIVVFGVLKAKGGKGSNIEWWKNSIKMSIPLIPHYLSLVLLNQSDKLMINYFVDAEHAAIYSVAHSAGLLMTILNTSINASFVPWLYTKLKTGNAQNVKKVSNALLGIIMVANILLVWFAPEEIMLLAPSQYKSAIWCLVPIAASVFFFFVYTLFVDVEIYYNGNIFIAIASVIAALLNMLLNWLLIPVFGYVAAGYTTLISYFVTMVLHYLFMKIVLRQNNKDDELFSLRIIILLSFLLIAICSLAMVLYHWFIIRLVMALFFCIIVFYRRDGVLKYLKYIRQRNAGE